MKKPNHNLTIRKFGSKNRSVHNLPPGSMLRHAFVKLVLLATKFHKVKPSEIGKGKQPTIRFPSHHSFIKIFHNFALKHTQRMRLLASIVISPHVRGRITPQKLLPFPWEKEKQTQQRVPVSKEEARARFERLLENIN